MLHCSLYCTVVDTVFPKLIQEVTVMLDQHLQLARPHHRGVEVVLLGLGGSWGDTVCAPKVKWEPISGPAERGARPL